MGVRETPMQEPRYYRFESGNVILRRIGDRVEKLGRDGVWVFEPYLMSYFLNGEEGLVEITEQEARELYTTDWPPAESVDETGEGETAAPRDSHQDLAPRG